MKAVKSKQEAPPAKYVWTEERKQAAQRFLRRIIEIQEIMDPYSATPSDHGDTVRGQVNGGYKEAVTLLCFENGVLEDLDRCWPFTTVTLHENGDGVLLSRAVFRQNGEMTNQAQTRGYLRGKCAGAEIRYEVKDLGKAQFSAAVVFGMKGQSSDQEYARQRIDILAAGAEWEFRCPFCENTARELYASYESRAFGCVPCLTVLDPEEEARYKRAKEAAAKPRSKKGGSV